jgi:hypothetical protein
MNQMAVRLSEVRWQQSALAPQSDFRGVLSLGLLTAWAYFLWQALQLPAFSGLLAGADPLLVSVVAKGRVVPDLGLIVAGMAVFHFRRQFRHALEFVPARRVIVQTALWLAVPLLVVLLLAAGLKLAAGLHGPVLWPWDDTWSRPQLFIMGFALAYTLLLPPLLHMMWANTAEIALSVPPISLGIYGFIFWTGIDHNGWTWALRLPVDFTLGVALASSLFRGMKYFTVVRWHGVIIGWLTLLGGSILRTPGLFMLGFILLALCFAMGERTRRLPGEGALLAWAGTAPAIFLVQPVILLAWTLWGSHLGLAPGHGLIVAAVLTQLLAVALFLGVQRPILRALPVPPAP